MESLGDFARFFFQRVGHSVPRDDSCCLSESILLIIHGRGLRGRRRVRVEVEQEVGSKLRGYFFSILRTSSLIPQVDLLSLQVIVESLGR